MYTRALALVALLLASLTASAADGPDAVYARMHAAALARDLDTVRSCTAEAERATLVIPELPKTYRLTGKAVRKDGNAVELRAVGTADSVGLGYTQIFGVVRLVREGEAWKVERLLWSTDRPGDYPEGYVLVEGEAPQPRSSAEPQLPRFTFPQPAPERSRLLNPRRAPEPPHEAPAGAEARPCEIKPVMSDEDLLACGARVPASR
jgi:hypothetical protein